MAMTIIITKKKNILESLEHMYYKFHKQNKHSNNYI